MHPQKVCVKGRRPREVMQAKRRWNEALPRARGKRNKVISEVNYALMKLVTLMAIKTKINGLSVDRARSDVTESLVTGLHEFHSPGEAGDILKTLLDFVPVFLFLPAGQTGSDTLRKC